MILAITKKNKVTLRTHDKG